MKSIGSLFLNTYHQKSFLIILRPRGFRNIEFTYNITVLNMATKQEIKTDIIKQPMSENTFGGERFFTLKFCLSHA